MVSWMPMAITALWAGLFAAAMALVFSSPPRAMPACFLGAATGRLARDALLTTGATLELATVVGAAAVGLVALALLRRANVSPVVMASAVLPLGAAGPFFRAIAAFVKLARVPADQQDKVSLDVVTNLSTMFMTTLALAIGISAAVLLQSLLARRAGR